MKAVVFEYKLRKLALSSILGAFTPKGYFTRLGHMKLKTIPDPHLFGDDWVIIRTEYCGICGSDFKQAFLIGNKDNPITAIISFPNVLGHEVVGIIEKAGPKVTRVKAGDRITLYPNLCCIPREIEPCEACQDGDFLLCRNLTDGKLAPGIHTGNSRDITGGFGELVPAHETMVFPFPDSITWKQAVLADPFCVALHGILKASPAPGSTCVVYGCGTLGLCTVHALKQLYQDINVIAITRYPRQVAIAKQFGADLVLGDRPSYGIVDKIGDYIHCDVHYPHRNKPWLIEGVDYVYDTVGSAETLEIGVRIVKARVKGYASYECTPGSIVITGVHSPQRFEWTPWYFKDINIIGSNAYATEDFEGTREHAYSHYLRLLEAGRIDPTPIITHTYPIAKWKDALVAAEYKKKSDAVKVVLTYGSENGQEGSA